jgi:hypothetical protein
VLFACVFRIKELKMNLIREINLNKKSLDWIVYDVSDIDVHHDSPVHTKPNVTLIDPPTDWIV